jgi:kynurenine formamidase
VAVASDQRPKEVGPAGDAPASATVEAARLIRTGQKYSLALPRFRGMPLFPGHPTFEVLSFRSPRGIRVAGDQPWGPHNDAGLGYMSELIQGSAHTGAHVDALAHMTIGPEGAWYGGGNADAHLGDFGPTVGDGSKLPEFFARGVLLDAAGWRGEQCLPAGHPLSGEDLQAIADHQGVEVRPWDIVLIRTGYLSWWPDADKLREHLTPGPDVSAAHWLSARGVVATGTDTETYEVQPAPDPGEPSNPQPVHTHLLIENGIYLFESLYLEEIAAEKVYEFCFVGLPTKIQGATGSMLDPVAVV